VLHLDAALEFFFPHAPIVSISPLGEGNINETLRVTLNTGQSWVLQRLHPGVFKDVDAVMANMRLVTEQLNQQETTSLEFFRLGANPNGLDQYTDAAGCSWRILSYIKDCRTLSQVHSPSQARAIGQLLGHFHQLSSGLSPEQLSDPLPGFHQTPQYLHHYDGLEVKQRFENAAESQCSLQIERLRPLATVLEEHREALTHRVIHGDPKVGNFLFARETEQAVSLIDLDTVKPGLLLHDLGDCLRSCCNQQGEAHPRPETTTFDSVLFTALMGGYLQQAVDLLNATDQALLVQSAAVISFELGLRFFIDHLENDHYFKVQHPGQNLHRACIQLQLSVSILEQQEDLEQQLASLLRSFT